MKLLPIILLLFSLQVKAATYHFANAGNDGTGNGSSSTPYATLVKLKSLSLSSGDSVLFNQGDNFTGTIYAVSGVYYGGYGSGAKPIINGFTTLSSWTSLGGGIYEAFLANDKVTLNLVTLDGANQGMGRWPDTGYRTYTAITATSITDATLSGSPYNWTGATGVVRDEFYIIDTAHITAMSGGFTFATSLNSTNARGKGYFVMNDSRTLLLTSRIGSWYNNVAVDSVQMYFGGGGTGGHTVKISTHDTLFYASSVSNVTVNGLDFEGSNQFTIFQNNTTNVVITNCNAKYGGNNFLTANNAAHATFTYDSIMYFNNNGAYTTGASSIYPFIEFNYIDSIGMIPGMGKSGSNSNYEGWAWGYGFGTYQYNTFKNIGYNAIYFSGDSVNVSNNYIDSFCMVKCDGAGIYTWDASAQTYTYGRIISNNIVVNGGSPVSGIVFDATDISFGIYCDGHSTSVTISNNTSALNASGGLFIHGSIITATGNNFFGNRYAQIYTAESAGAALTSLVLKNNRVVNSSGNGSQLLMSFTTPLNDLASFGTVDSNTFAGYTASTVFFTKSSADGGTNRALASWNTNLSYDAHSTYQSGVNNIFYNNSGTNNATKTLLHGKFQDLNGSIYLGTLYLSPYTSLNLVLQNTNYLAIPYGLTLQSSN
jgi:hypothetical protein